MGRRERISASEAVQGRTTEKTFCSRMRRAMSWVYWLPKSRMTIEEVSTLYFFRVSLSEQGQKAQSRRDG